MSGHGGASDHLGTSVPVTEIDRRSALGVKTNVDYLQAIADEDVAGLRKAQESYGDSWKRRGGIGAFMMLARKWDRLEQALRPANRGASIAHAASVRDHVPAYDIFALIASDKRTEGAIDDVRDLRRYLLLVESEMRAQGVVHGAHRDNA